MRELRERREAMKAQVAASEKDKNKEKPAGPG